MGVQASGPGAVVCSGFGTRVSPYGLFLPWQRTHANSRLATIDQIGYPVGMGACVEEVTVKRCESPCNTTKQWYWERP